MGHFLFSMKINQILLSLLILIPLGKKRMCQFVFLSISLFPSLYKYLYLYPPSHSFPFYSMGGGSGHWGFSFWLSNKLSVGNCSSFFFLHLSLSYMCIHVFCLGFWNDSYYFSTHLMSLNIFFFTISNLKFVQDENSTQWIMVLLITRGSILPLRSLSKYDILYSFMIFLSANVVQETPF